jgi:hypothetical protein
MASGAAPSTNTNPFGILTCGNPPRPPRTSKGEGGSATAAPATPPQSTSLLQATDRNPLQDNAFNPLETSPGSTGVRNDETAIGWRQVLRSLKAQRSRQKQDQQVPANRPFGIESPDLCPETAGEDGCILAIWGSDSGAGGFAVASSAG